MKYIIASILSLFKTLCHLGILFILTINVAYAQSVSQAAGKWEDAATWVAGIIPTPGSDVTVNHVVTIDAVTPDANISDINSILITNTQNAHAILSIGDGKNLTVLNDIIVTGTDANFFTYFLISGASTQVDIGGDLTYTDQNTFDRGVILNLDETSILNVTGDFTYSKEQNPALPTIENDIEINLGSTAGSAPVFTVGGSVNLNYNLSQIGYFRLDLRNSSTLTASNLNLTSTTSGEGVAEPQVDLVVGIYNDSKVEITGTTTMDYTYDGVNKEHENIIDVFNDGLFSTQNLLMVSNDNTSTQNNIVRSNNTSTIKIVQNAEFQRTGSSDNRILAQDDSRIVLSGSHTNSNNFTWQFNNNSTFSLNGTGVQTLPVPYNKAYRNLLIKNSSGTAIVLTGAANVHNVLSLIGGIVSTSATNLLTIMSTGSSSLGSNTSHIDGPIAKVGNTDFEFPVGDNGFWEPLSVSNLSASTTITAEYLESTPPNNTTLKSPDPNGDLLAVSGLEYWEVTTSADVTADLTLYWKDDNRSEIYDPTSLSVAHSLGTEWENYGNDGFTQNSPEGSITVANIGIQSVNPVEYFTFGTESALNTLPVRLVRFSGAPKNQTIEIQWETTYEQNNDFFELQKSIDGDQFDVIGVVNGLNNGDVVSTYNYIDYAPVNGIQYYRIRQVDFNGDYDYSKTILIKFSGNNTGQPYIFPNPSSGDYINIKIPGNEILLSVHILDKLGKRINTKFQDNNSNQYLVCLPHLRKGIHIIQVKTNTSTYNQKIIKE